MSLCKLMHYLRYGHDLPILTHADDWFVKTAERQMAASVFPGAPIPKIDPSRTSIKLMPDSTGCCYRVRHRLHQHGTLMKIGT